MQSLFDSFLHIVALQRRAGLKFDQIVNLIVTLYKTNVSVRSGIFKLHIFSKLFYKVSSILHKIMFFRKRLKLAQEKCG